MNFSPKRALLFLFWICWTGAAACQGEGTQLPEAPSASKQAKQKTAKKQFDFRLLAKRSKIFPDLAASDKPLGARQKLQLAVSESLSPAAVGGALFSAGLSQARDSLPGYGQGAEGYGKRFGAAMATSTSSQLFGTFLLPTALHQDPRFFVQGNGSLSQSVGYGLRRLVITRTDKRGEAINWSGLMGPLAAQGLANTYLPDGERTAARTFQRYGISLGLRAGVNIAKEYWPTIFKGLTKARGNKRKQ
jgi:hypothetical protein